MKKSVLFILLPLLLVVSACQGKPPRISGMEWSLLEIKNTADGVYREYLSFFARTEDPDGVEDIEDFYLSSTDSRLFWHLSGENWTKRSANNETWIGSTALTAPAGIPRGAYKLQLIDRGGEEAVDSIYIDLPEFDQNEYQPNLRIVPELELSGDTGSIRGNGGPYQCVAVNSEGEISAVFETPSSIFDTSNYTKSAGSGTLQWYVFEFESDRGWYIGSGPY